jgi:hypothetical protein
MNRCYFIRVRYTSSKGWHTQVFTIRRRGGRKNGSLYWHKIAQIGCSFNSPSAALARARTVSEKLKCVMEYTDDDNAVSAKLPRIVEDLELLGQLEHYKFIAAKLHGGLF